VKPSWRTIQQVLGHSSPHTALAFYTQSVEESQRNAISKLEAIMSPDVPKFEDGLPLTNRKDWLGDLDSNQDSQIQSQETESNQPPDKPLKT
jgi:hypothetical protein